MSYSEEIARVVNTCREEVEVDLAVAQSNRNDLEARLIEADRKVATLEMLLVMGSFEDMRTSEPVSQLTLHEAMREVLLVAPQQRMPAVDIARDIEKRGLYRMRDGRPVEAQQIHARVGNYGHMFERDGHGIRLL